MRIPNVPVSGFVPLSQHRSLWIHKYDQHSLTENQSLTLHPSDESNLLIYNTSNASIDVLSLPVLLIQVSPPTFNAHIYSPPVFRTCSHLHPPYQWQLWACLYTDAASSNVNYPAAALQALDCSFSLRCLCAWARSEECGNVW